MQRNIVLPIVGGVVAALILVGAILVISKNNKDKTDLTISTPVATSAEPSPSATEEPSGSPSPSPTASATPKASLAPTATATPAPTPTPYRAATTVNCSNAQDKRYCSQPDGMVVASKKMTKAPENKGAITYPDSPTITMVSTVRKPDNSTAHQGDEVSAIHVEVTIQNNTKKTFVFPKREIDLVVTRDGKAFGTLPTSGGGFAMTPGAKMTGKFDQPITKDGTYGWQAKTWYYTK